MKKTMKIYMAAALLAVVSPAILAQAPVKVVCNELKPVSYTHLRAHET